MKTITSDKVTLHHLRNLRRYNYIASFLAVLITSGSVLWLLLHREDANAITLFASVVYPCTLCLSAFWALLTFSRARNGVVSLEARYQFAWLLIGLGILLSLLGGGDSASPGYTGFLPLSFYGLILSHLFYPLAFVGLLLMHSTIRFRVIMLFDALITTLCMIGICWFFVAVPNHLSVVNVNTWSPAITKLIVALVDPCGDMLLILALALLIQHGVERTVRGSLLLIGVALLVLILVDTIHAYMYITGKSLVIARLIDPFWLAGFLLFGLSALYQYSAFVRSVYKEQMQQAAAATPGTVLQEGITWQNERTRVAGWRGLQNLLSYVPLILLLSLLIFTDALDDGRISNTLALLSTLAAALLALRHFFATRENDMMLKERELRYAESEHVRHLVTQLSDIRNLEYLRERITLIVPAEFGFTAAMLVLVEEYNSPLSSQSHLLVNTASISTHATKWRLRGDNVLYRTVLSEKSTIVQWGAHTQDTPAEVRLWQEKQHISSMLFFPIIYQEKVLGCLGVARHALSLRSQTELAILRAYTEEIAAVIEHAYLYQEAREREAFARGMANIATRLNAAVVEPAEIGQLICQEGANALRADYVILYTRNEDEQLLEPFASSVNQDEPAADHGSWPSFPISEGDRDVPYALHPYLLDSGEPRLLDADGGGDSVATSPASEHDDQEETAPSHPLRSKLARHDIRVAIIAPLITGGRSIGMLIFARTTPPGTSRELAFDASDLPHAQDFVEQAGVAFVNARLYKRLHATHEKLKELDQLKDQFMITASHELRTPLTTVQGYIELIAQYDEVLPPEQRRDFLQKAQLGCDELAVLLRNVMDASRLEAEAGIKPALMERVSVRHMIEKVQVMIEPQVTHERRVVEVAVPPDIFVYADPLRLQQVLMNISTNALKYSPPGTPLGFAASIQAGQERSAVISIRDRGKGVTPEDQVHLFERFYRLESDLNSPIRGSGLGLYISRRLVEAMEGKVWIESRGVPGEGSTFHIQLPMA